MKYLSILLLLILAFACPSTDWNTFKGSLERTGSSDSPAPDTGYLEWKVDFSSPLCSSPVIINDKVIQVAFEKIKCISIHTGEVLWTSSVPTYNSTPALSDDKVVVATNRGISAISIENGNLLWEYMVSGRFSEMELIDYIVSSPGISDGKVVVGTLPYSYWVVDSLFGSHEQNELFLVCLDEETGKEIWYRKTKLGVFSAPCISYGKLFVTSREILCIDLEDGNELWNSENKYPYALRKPFRERYAFDYSTPAVYHGILIGGSLVREWLHAEPKFIGQKKIVAMDQYTGDILWEWTEEGFLASSPAIFDGKIYFYSYDGMVHCISLLDGKELWRTSISEPQEFDDENFKLWPSPSAADGKVYIGSVERNFYCLNSDTGEILWKYETGPIYSSPAISQERVLISSEDGFLYCFGIDPETYMRKAKKYVEDEDYEKAEQFLIKARESAKTDEEVKEIEELLDFVNDHKGEYQKRQEKGKEAESLMNEADRILWNDQFKNALALYVRAREIYTSLGEEFEVSFCETRIDYIKEKIPEDDREIPKEYLWILVIVICMGGAALLLRKTH